MHWLEPLMEKAEKLTKVSVKYTEFCELGKQIHLKQTLYILKK